MNNLDVPGNGSLFMQSLIKRLLRLLERDPKSIIQKAIDESSEYITLCSIEGCLQICNGTRFEEDGEDNTADYCGKCDKTFCHKFHSKMIQTEWCANCCIDICNSCGPLPKEYDICGDSYCNVCFPEHKKQNHYYDKLKNDFCPEFTKFND